MEHSIKIVTDIGNSISSASHNKAVIECHKCGKQKEVFVSHGANEKEAKLEAAKFFKGQGWTVGGPKYLPVCKECAK
jgi:hypothetical protein